MTDITTAPAPRRRNWIKLIGMAVGILVLLIVVMYFVVTSSGFIKGVILPKVSKAMGTDITVSDISLSPLKQVVLKDLKVQSPGREALFTSPEVEVRYRLMDILKGNYVVDLVSVKSPVLALVVRPDKTSNLDPIMQAMGQDTNKNPMNLDLKKLVVSNGTIRYEQSPSAAGSLSAEISNFNLNIDGLSTSGVGKIAATGDLRMQSAAPAPGTNGSLAATIKCDMDLGLTPLLMPSVIKGGARVQITDAKAGYAMASGMGLAFDADVTSTDVKQLALRLLQGEKTLGELAASGPFSMEKLEGTIDVRLSNIDKQALNLASAGSGMDFGGTTINSTNRIQLVKGGQSLTATGALLVSNLQITRTNLSTPILNLQAGYDLSVDQAKSNLVLRALTMNGSQSGKDFLKAGLSAPMTVSWGNEAAAAGDATLTLEVTAFNLGDWKAFMGDALSSGVVNSKIEVAAKEAGKRIVFTHRSGIDGLSMACGSNQVSGVSVVLAGDGEAKNMEQLTTKYELNVNHRNSPALQVAGTASYNKTGAEAQAQAKGGVIIPTVIGMLSLPDAKFTSGTAEFGLGFKQKAGAQNIDGEFNLKDLTGHYGSNTFQSFGAQARMEAAMDPQKAELRKATLTLSQAGKDGGSVDMTGSYGMSNQVAQFKATIKDLNQNVLVSFLQSALGDKTLTSVSVNGQAGVDYDPKKPSSISADFKVSNLVVKDPKGKVAAKPLEASMACETTIDKQVVDIRKGLLTLTPTDRAKNQMQMTGKIDMSNTNYTSGNIKVTSDGLDVTTYYDIFMGDQSSAQAQPTAVQPAPAGPEKDPEPMILPITNFVAEVNVARFYLRELDITNFVVTTSINGGRIKVDPFQMSINGAPLRSTINLDLGVPGWKYDVDFQMTQVPFAPLVNTFVPERKGQLGGTLTAGAQVKGVGTTGESLQKNLSGNFMFGTTNLDFSISAMKSSLLKTVVNVIEIVPSILKNPSSGISSLAGTIFGGSSTSGTAKPAGAWTDELTKSPIDIIGAKGSMGSGTVNLERALVQSRAFQAEAKGTIQLAKILTNSAVNIPLTVSIKRSLAESANLVTPETATNATYVKLPDYVTIKGTVGEPKTDINKMALLGTVLKQYGGSVGLDKKTGSALQGLGSMLTGSKAGGTNAATATQTNAPGGLLKGIGGLLGTPAASTNQPATTVTNQPQTQTNPVGSMIQGLFGKPKKK